MMKKIIKELIDKNEGNIILANKERIKLIKNKTKFDIDNYFDELENFIKINDIENIKMLFETKMFYEIANKLFLEDLIKTYNILDSLLKKEYIHNLHESYSIRATTGYMFTFGGIVKRFNASAINRCI